MLTSVHLTVGIGCHLYRESDRPTDVALLQKYLKPVEVYEKRPFWSRAAGNRRRQVPDDVRMCLYTVQRGVCPGCGIHLPHYLRFEVDHILALSDDGEDQVFNLQVLCSYCDRVKATRGSHGFRMKMAELRAHNVVEGLMVVGCLAELTGRRLAQYRREIGQ